MALIDQTKQLYLDFIYDLYRSGIFSDDKRIFLLRKNNYILPENEHREKSEGIRKKGRKKQESVPWDFSHKTKIEQKADSHIDIVSQTPAETILTEKKYQTTEKIYTGGKNISTDEWKPVKREIQNYPPDFINWIDSINTGFRNRIQYKRFNLYTQQAQVWLAENVNFNDAPTADMQLSFAIEEIKRIRANTLYFLEKYVVYKEGTADAGGHRYKAFDAHRILCYLVDCGYNLMIGKPRQLWFTTTMGGIAVKKTNFFKSHFIKFITENLKKGQEIFEDKIKFPFYHMPEWIKCTVNNDQEGLLRLVRKNEGQKGTIGGVDSKLVVEAPYITAINGGSPDIVLIDEIGQIKILSEMIKEGRPTLFGYNHQLNVMEQKRQIIAWGTGGNMLHGGAEFKEEYLSCLQMWRERKFHHGFIPLFFDAFAKPGMTKEIYEQEREAYYGKGTETAKVQFHQHYPLTIDDMFLSSAETIIPMAKINQCLEKIYSMPPETRPQKGYFEPVYDTNQPYEENSFLPYKLIGVNFVPCNDSNDNATVTVFEHPVKKWTNRYYQGTDPIFSENGHSKMASAIWDAENNTVSACVNYREQDYRFCYLQCILLGLYYSNETKDLVEINVGKEYVHFKEMYGFYRTVVGNKMLPRSLQTQTTKDGISKKANTAKGISNRHHDMIFSFIDNIFIEEYFIQLKTFTRNVRETQTGLNESFKVENPKYWYDDVIDAIVYAYICSECYANFPPKNISESNGKRKIKRYICDASTGYRTILKEIFV